MMQVRTIQMLLWINKIDRCSQYWHKPNVSQQKQLKKYPEKSSLVLSSFLVAHRKFLSRSILELIKWHGVYSFCESHRPFFKNQNLKYQWKNLISVFVPDRPKWKELKFHDSPQMNCTMFLIHKIQFRFSFYGLTRHSFLQLKNTGNITIFPLHFPGQLCVWDLVSVVCEGLVCVLNWLFCPGLPLWNSSWVFSDTQRGYKKWHKGARCTRQEGDSTLTSSILWFRTQKARLYILFNLFFFSFQKWNLIIFKPWHAAHV